MKAGDTRITALILGSGRVMYKVELCGRKCNGGLGWALVTTFYDRNEAVTKAQQIAVSYNATYLPEGNGNADKTETDKTR